MVTGMAIEGAVGENEDCEFTTAIYSPRSVANLPLSPIWRIKYFFK